MDSTYSTILIRSKLLSNGDDDNVITRIIAGTETGIHEYPWMVSLQLGGNHFCGATLISEDWILTAAHCVEFGFIGNFMERVRVIMENQSFDSTVSEHCCF